MRFRAGGASAQVDHGRGQGAWTPRVLPSGVRTLGNRVARAHLLGCPRSVELRPFCRIVLVTEAGSFACRTFPTYLATVAKWTARAPVASGATWTGTLAPAPGLLLTSQTACDSVRIWRLRIFLRAAVARDSRRVSASRLPRPRSDASVACCDR